MKFLQIVLLLGVVAAQDVRINLRSHLQLLMDRPAEPLFLAKGQRSNFVFDIPEEFVPARFRKKAFQRPPEFQPTNVIRIQKLEKAPDLSFPQQLGRREQFSQFVPKHRLMTKQIVELLMKNDTNTFLSNSAFCHDRINPFMYSYALSVAMHHRRDTAGSRPPHVPSLFPEKFFDGAAFSRVREEVALINEEDRRVIEIPRDFTATDLEPEHRVAYFREDIGVNLHHWNWHVAFPGTGGLAVVTKDRRGELFYYMHQQLLGRYNFERLSTNLARVQRLLNWRKPIEEGYFPKLNSIIASRVWQPRPANSLLKDISRDDMELEFDILDLERWRDRIYTSISAGRVLAENGSYIPLDEFSGIDILGNLIERSELSINSNLYGDLHGLGHVAIAVIHDPDHKHLEQAGVMGAVETAMRDPVFYRWHSFINDMLVAHKQTLQPYTLQELGFNNIRVVRADVETQNLGRANEFSTFWMKDDFNVGRGLDFMGNGSVYVRVTHLIHTPFRYLIQIENGGPPRMGTVRIFMAPRNDERGKQLPLREQRYLFIEMDKFQMQFRSGLNNIERLSTQSSVTIPRENTFRDPDEEIGESAPQADFCACGWPQHMLVPRGKVKGLEAELFVMVSDGAGDQVRDPSGPPDSCTNAHSLCGIRNRMYPDRRPMGYPFDRLLRTNTLDEFLLPNMKVTPVLIRHRDEVVLSPRVRNG